MRRNDLDICADILKVSKAGAKKTHIVYKANLNFRIVKKYLSRLIDNGLLNDGSDSGIYVTTGKGSEFLEQYARLTIPLMPTGID
jgi:predicted transcriptional regulator